MLYNPFISVVIPTYHDWDRLSLCLNKLSEQSISEELFEIIIVNNDPNDKAPTDLVLPKNALILEESKPGSYAARNKALSVAKGEVYAFTDSDCQPKKDWLETAINYFNEKPEIDRIGGNIKLITKKEKPNWFEVYEIFFAFPQDEFISQKGMAATANMISKKTVFDQTGLFDESLMSGGDAQWGMRASAQGFSLDYVESCVVHHPTRDQYTDIMQKNKRVAGGHLMMAKKEGTAAVMNTIVRGFFPPVHAMKRVLKMKNQPIRYKLIAIAMAYFLKLSATFTKIHILLNKDAIERV